MARPSTTDDVTERTLQLATFHFEKFATNPALVKAYAEFIAEAGGETELLYGTVTVTVPKTQEQLESQLKSDQSTWDVRQRIYERHISGEETKYEAVARSFATAEGLPFESTESAQT